ncbi:MAG: hypothetical protein Ct9H300mP12_16230 [Acidimicrobiales bacterium]|nr:MAG: hypothetical protein Ct9H300mP12_16230 [Acidimicrobiales bacterium]
MAWIDGLDIPFVRQLDAGFFEFGSETLSTRDTPSRARKRAALGTCRSLAGWCPYDKGIAAHGLSRGKSTDAALTAQLKLEERVSPVLSSQAMPSFRYTNPATGGDALTTIRTEMHRLAAGCRTASIRVAGSAVWQVFAGGGEIELEGELHTLKTGDLFVVPSWAELSLATETGLDAFRFF